MDPLSEGYIRDLNASIWTLPGGRGGYKHLEASDKKWVKVESQSNQGGYDVY